MGKPLELPRCMSSILFSPFPCLCFSCTLSFLLHSLSPPFLSLPLSPPFSLSLRAGFRGGATYLWSRISLLSSLLLSLPSTHPHNLISPPALTSSFFSILI